MNVEMFEYLVESIGVINNTVSGPTGERNGECCLYLYELDNLKNLANRFDFRFKITEEFIDGNGDDCIVVELEELDDDPNFTDSAGFSIADREDEEESSHHCDDPSCNCSI